MIRIVIDARELRTSTGRYVERLLHYLQEVDNNLSHRYIVLLSPQDMDTWEPKSKRFTKVACRYKAFSFGEQLGFAWQLYRLKPHLVHFAMPQQPLLYLGKSVTTIHDLTTVRFGNPAKNRFVFKVKQQVYAWLIKIATRRSKAVIAISEFSKDDVAKFAHMNSRKITVTYEAADEITDAPQPTEELEGKQFIMYIGRPQPHKNLRRLLKTFSELQTKNPELHLVLAGKKDSLYKRHARWVKKHGIENVIFTGFVSEAQLRWLYENCAAYVFPSLSEGFGLPGLEAMVHGAPVVSSNATCLPEIYGDAVEYFDPQDINDMAHKINRVITNNDRRQSLIKAGKKQAAKYSWRRMAEQTLAVYNDSI